jgi:hypothetical protein
MPHTLTLDQVAQDLSFSPQDLQVFREDWDKTAASYPRSHPVFLTPGYITQVCKELALSDEMASQALKALSFFHNRPAALRLAWHCHAALFELANVHYRHIAKWPEFTEKSGPGAPMFNFFIMLSGLKQVLALHAQRGIAPQVTREMFLDAEIWARDSVTRTGVWGVKSLGWIWHHLTGRLYQLGRLQYTLDEGWLPYLVYRNTHTRQVVALAGHGMKFRADGQCFDADRTTDPNAWTATLVETDKEIVGSRIDPEGRAVPGPVSLPKSHWECVLKPGDPTIGFHMPASGPLDHGACGESLARAVTFFTKHYPERPFKAFNCASWLLDNQLPDVLPRDGNIVRFQRETYLVPAPGATDGQTLDRVFPAYAITPQSLDHAPNKTSLQKAFIKELKAGRKFRTGACYLFVEDLDWGKSVYLTTRAWRGN